MALGCGEELVRRKEGFGFELGEFIFFFAIYFYQVLGERRLSFVFLFRLLAEENAVNLVYAFVGLNNNYELPDFDRQRQNALTALVACCPRKAAP